MGLLPRCELTLPGQLTRASPFSQNATVLTRRRKEALKNPLCFHQSVRNPSSLQCFFSCEPYKNLKKKKKERKKEKKTNSKIAVSQSSPVQSNNIKKSK